MERVVYIKGEWLPEREAKLDYFDSAFMYGLTVYEAVRTFNYKPFKIDQHLDRLMRSLKVTRIELSLDRDELRDIAVQLLEKNRESFNPPEDDTWIFYNISAGRWPAYWKQGDVYDPHTICANLLPLDFSRYAKFYLTGCHVVTPATRQIPPQCLDPKLKHRSRLYLALANHEVHQVDPEARSLLLDLNGNVTESSGANFFIVEDGAIKTSPTDSVLVGISRQTVLEIAKELKIPVREMNFQLYDVYNADEAFLTATSFCVLPVTKVNGVVVGDGRPGPIVKQLLDAWSERVGIDIVGQALQSAGLL